MGFQSYGPGSDSPPAISLHGATALGLSAAINIRHSAVRTTAEPVRFGRRLLPLLGGRGGRIDARALVQVFYRPNRERERREGREGRERADTRGKHDVPGWRMRPCLSVIVSLQPPISEREVASRGFHEHLSSTMGDLLPPLFQPSLLPLLAAQHAPAPAVWKERRLKCFPTLTPHHDGHKHPQPIQGRGL
jgi:hypothetical protein